MPLMSRTAILKGHTSHSCNKHEWHDALGSPTEHWATSVVGGTGAGEVAAPQVHVRPTAVVEGG